MSPEQLHDLAQQVGERLYNASELATGRNLSDSPQVRALLISLMAQAWIEGGQHAYARALAIMDNPPVQRQAG